MRSGKLATLFVLCLIAVMLSACARRTARAHRGPSLSSPLTGTSQKPRGADGSRRVRDAIQSLKNRLENNPAHAAEVPTPGSAPGVPPTGGASRPGQQGVGTSGAWSVETRYPAAAAPGASSAGDGPAPRGRLLSRARAAVGHAGGRAWAGVAGLSLAAVVIVAALLLRRSRHVA